MLGETGNALSSLVYYPFSTPLGCVGRDLGSSTLVGMP